MSRRVRSVLCSVGLIALLVLPVMVASTIVLSQGVGVSFSFAAALVLLAIPITVLVKISRTRFAYYADRRSVLGWLDSLVERSFLGAGSLKGWSSTNPNVSLAHLRGSEVPFVAAVGVAARTTQPVPSIKAAPVEVGSFDEYTVMRGDTFWSLAERFLGAGNKWSELHRLNVGRAVAPGVVLDDDDSLVPGWKIAVPTQGQRV